MVTGRVVTDLNVGSRRKVKIGNQIFQSLYNMVVFTANSRNEWLAVFEKGLGLYFYLGSFVGSIVFKTGLYFYDLVVSKNKNIGKVGSFLREFIAMIILMTAIFGGLTASVTIAAVTPWLYVGSLLVSLAYNLSIATQNAYHWLTSNNPEARRKYKESFKDHLFTTIFVGLLTVSLTLLMAVKIIPTAMAIVSACLNGVSFVLAVRSAYKMYQANHSKSLILAANPAENEANKKASQQQQKLNALAQLVEPQNQYDDDYYFHCRERANALPDQADPRNYLLQQIDQKIDLLHEQMNHERSRFFSQENKRLIKIDVLEQLSYLLNDPSKTKDDFYALLKSPAFNHFFNNPFQSFFRQKSDTQDIFEAAESYFNQIPEINQPTSTMVAACG